MIVEDEFAIRDCLTDLLDFEGYRTISARDGQDALNVLEAALELPSLVLLDFAMPILDGHGFRRAQLEIPRIANIPVILFSADSRIEKISNDFGKVEY